MLTKLFLFPLSPSFLMEFFSPRLCREFMWQQRGAEFWGEPCRQSCPTLTALVSWEK